MVWVTLFLFFNPNFWGYDPISRAFFHMGWFNHQLDVFIDAPSFYVHSRQQTPLFMTCCIFFSCHSLPASMPHQPPTDDWLMPDDTVQEIFNRTHWMDPEKPEYLIALASNLLGPESVGIRFLSIFDGHWGSFMWQTVQGYPYFAPWLVWYVSTIEAIQKKEAVSSGKWAARTLGLVDIWQNEHPIYPGELHVEPRDHGGGWMVQMSCFPFELGNF